VNRDHHYLYEAVAQQLTDAIRQNTFAVGERMPSLRQLADRHRISMATALQAYRLLEDRGLLVARPRSGYYVREAVAECETGPPISRPPDQPNLPINMQYGLQFQEMMTQRGLLSLGVTADPAPELVPAKALGRILAGVARRAADMPASYGYPMGHDGLRVQIARRMADAGCYCKPSEIVVTNGCQASLGLCLRVLAKPGDTVAIESPTFVANPHLLAVLGLKALEIPTHPQTGIDVDALEQAIQRHAVAACLLAPTCQNPLGASMPEANKRRVVDMLAGAGIPLIEDDALGDLSFERPRPKAAKAFDQDDNVLYCSSLSKVLGPGQRVGWIATGRHHDAIAYLRGVLDSVAWPTWQHHALAQFLAGGGYARAAGAATRVYAKRVSAMRRKVLEHFPDGTLVTNPSGGFNLWVELPDTIDVNELLRRALEHNVGFAPGMLFSPTWSYTHHLRLSCGGSRTWDRTEHAIALLGGLAKQLAG